MKKYLSLFTLLLLFSAVISAQKISKPTKNGVEPTAEQMQIITEGSLLHEAKKYDEAIKKYAQVLQESPDNTVALYETAFSYFMKGDQDKALEFAVKGTGYKSRTLPRFYQIVAIIWEEQGKIKEAIELYKDGIKIVQSDKNLNANPANLFLSLGIVYAKQKLFTESRDVLKKAVESDFSLATANYYLSEIYFATKYKVPAILAATRLISLEKDTARSKRAAAIFLDVMKAAKKDDKGNINIFLDLSAPKDEGDYGVYDLLLGTLTAVKDEKDKDKSENQLFAEAVDTFISLLSEDKKLKSFFVGKNYVPFMIEMKSKGHSQTFAYLVLQQNGDADAAKWIAANVQKVSDFRNWAKDYKN